MLHVVFGDSAAGTLRRVVPDDRVLSWPDPLSCGPVGTVADLVAWIPLRQRYWHEQLEVNDAGLHMNRALEALRDTSQVMLWVGTMADEQLLAAWTLAILRDHNAACSVDVVMIDPHPRNDGFSALGHHTPDEAEALLTSARPLPENDGEHYIRAWEAWSHPDPSLLLDFIARGAGPAGLVAALNSLRGRYPDAVRGLSHWEHRLLHHLSVHQPDFVRAMGHVLVEMSTGGPLTAGDSWLHAQMRKHAAPRASRPLLLFEADSPHMRRQRAELTPDGLAVLAGTANAFCLNGYADFVGGVTLGYPHGELWVRTGDSLVPHTAV